MMRRSSWFYCFIPRGQMVCDDAVQHAHTHTRSLTRRRIYIHKPAPVDTNTNASQFEPTELLTLSHAHQPLCTCLGPRIESIRACACVLVRTLFAWVCVLIATQQILRSYTMCVCFSCQRLYMYMCKIYASAQLRFYVVNWVMMKKKNRTLYCILLHWPPLLKIFVRDTQWILFEKKVFFSPQIFNFPFSTASISDWIFRNFVLSNSIENKWHSVCDENRLKRFNVWMTKLNVIFCVQEHYKCETPVERTSSNRNKWTAEKKKKDIWIFSV